MENTIVETAVDRVNESLLKEWATFLDAPAAPKLETANDRRVMALLLNNAKESIQRNEDINTTTVFGSEYLPAILGLIRQVYPRLMALDLVHTQPLDRPTGRVYFMDTKRSDGTFPTFQANPLADTRSTSQLGTQWQSYADWASSGENQLINASVSLTMSHQDVSVQSSKLKTQYTPELMQDLAAYWPGINAADVLHEEALNELAREIDAKIIRAIRNNIGAGTVTFGTQSPAGFTFTEWRTRLNRAVLNASANIQRYRGGQTPTWMIAGTSAVTELLDSGNISVFGNAPVQTDNMGIQRVGIFQGLNMNVLHVPYLPENEIILGRKGTSWTDAGAIFLPYVLLFLGQTIWDPNYMTYTRSFMSRYGLQVTNPLLFSRVIVDPTSSGLH